MADAKTILQPPALKPGDQIGLIAPASSFSREGFTSGCDRLRRMGYEPVFAKIFSIVTSILPVRRNGATVSW